MKKIATILLIFICTFTCTFAQKTSSSVKPVTSLLRGDFRFDQIIDKIIGPNGKEIPAAGAHLTFEQHDFGDKVRAMEVHLINNGKHIFIASYIRPYVYCYNIQKGAKVIGFFILDHEKKILTIDLKQDKWVAWYSGIKE